MASIYLHSKESSVKITGVMLEYIIYLLYILYNEET